MSDRISVGDVEDRKLKRQLEEETEDSLTLRLCSNYHKGGDTTGSGSGSGSSSATKAESGVEESNLSTSKGLDVEPSSQRWRRRQFICKFCNQNFRSGQALGGHLNTHRGESDLIKKMDQETEVAPSYLGQISLAPAPYNSPMANLSSLGGSRLSHSGVHVPPHAGAMSWPSHGYGYGIGSNCGSAAPTVGVNGAAGGFGSDSWLAILNINSNNPTAAGLNIGGLEQNRCEGNNNQQHGSSARGAGEEQDLDLSLSL